MSIDKVNTGTWPGADMAVLSTSSSSFQNDRLVIWGFQEFWLTRLTHVAHVMLAHQTLGVHVHSKSRIM